MNATTERLQLKRCAGRVFDNPTRFRVVVAGRRFGKSRLGVFETIAASILHKRANIWYIAPTHEMVQALGWEPIKAQIPPEFIFSKHETRLQIRLMNGSTIVCKSADRPDRLRGEGLDLVILDESRWMEARTWPEILRPALSDRLGRALFLTTPGGYDWTYDLWLKGQEDVEDWASWSFTTLDGGWVPEAEVEAARRDMDPRTFRQEYEASFEEMQGRVYYTFDRKVHVDPSVKDTGGDLYVGQDFNVHPMASALAVKMADEIHFIDSWLLPNSNTEELVAELRIRYPDRRIIMCPDPSGAGRRTAAPVGQTDFTILKRAGYEVRAPKQAPPVVDRENNTNANLRSASGRVRVKLHPRCKALIRGYEGLTYKEGTSQRDKTSGLDHICDAADYLLWQESNLVTPDRTMTVGDFSI